MRPPALIELFVLRERDGSATDARLGSAKFNPPTDQDLEDENDTESRLGDLDEAGPGDRAVVKDLGAMALKRLSNFPWKRMTRDRVSDHEVRFKKFMDDEVACLLSVMPTTEHSRVTRRGAGAREGWMLDCEIHIDDDSDEVRWIFHTERRYKTPREALAAATALMDFVDQRSLIDLLEVPRSGPLSMSAWRD